MAKIIAKTTENKAKTMVETTAENYGPNLALFFRNFGCSFDCSKLDYKLDWHT